MPHFSLIIIIILSLLLSSQVIKPINSAESSTCLTVYKQGGAPAVFQSPKCPRWKLSDDHFTPPRTPRCQLALHQGRRVTQEDRLFCALDIPIPFPGANGLTEMLVGLVAVFDGHNGSEASDMAYKLLLEYFILHTYFLLDATFPSFLKRYGGTLLKKEVETFASQMFKDREQILQFVRAGRLMHKTSEKFGSSFRREILKESLLRTIEDIDSTFSKEAFEYNLGSGSTATVVLVAEGQILVANLGDSKALLCSEQYQSPAEAKASALRLYHQKRRDGIRLRFKDCESCNMVASEGIAHLVVKELTRDHRPDRDDEKSRVEKSGGYVLEWSGVPRVNGQLAVSRAIGDVSFKSYGVTSSPEVTDWQHLNFNDSYLIAASDGVFEGLEVQDVCDLLWEVQNDDPSSTSQLSSACSAYSLADCIVSTALDRGGVDNMAAAVIPLKSMGLSKTFSNDVYTENSQIGCSILRSDDFGDKQTGGGVSGSLVQVGNVHPIIAKFDRLLIEGKHGYFSCYYLFENLKENEDYVFGPIADKRLEDSHAFHALPGALDDMCGAPSFVNEEVGFCFHSGMISDGNIEKTRYPKDFDSFLHLLESIPLQYAESKFGSSDHVRPDLRYMLKKRFGQGAYGEVWLAFQWNCSERENTSDESQLNQTSSGYHLHSDKFHQNSENFSSSQDSNGTSDGNLFILKRIMVERGSGVYLSGLREKYFGEIFSNATAFLGGFPASEDSNLIFNETEAYFYGPFQSGSIVVEEGLNHIARYVESFESRSNEIWLVFKHEGMSLSKLMYTAGDAEKVTSESAGQVLQPSKWWQWLKTTKAGQHEMRSLIWQLLLALKSCHDRNITHRDIKPENMVICIEDQDTRGCLKGSPNGDVNHATKMRIIDFGSAIDDSTVRRLYGTRGPSRAEQTYEYTPPEALLNTSWYLGPISRTLKYDMWSVGVVFLELVLGSPDVFQISTVSHALLDKIVEGWNEDLKDLAYRLRSFMEMCILVPGISAHHKRSSFDQEKVPPASWKCSEDFFLNLIKSRDPLRIGFPNVWAMRLVRQLLLWDPDDRLSVDEALQHPYFLQPLR